MTCGIATALTAPSAPSIDAPISASIENASKSADERGAARAPAPPPRRIAACCGALFRWRAESTRSMGCVCPLLFAIERKEQLAVLDDALEVGAGQAFVPRPPPRCRRRRSPPAAGAAVAEDGCARRDVGQPRLQPQLDAPRADQRRRQIADVHRRHHHAHAAGARALQTVEHRQQVAVEPVSLPLSKMTSLSSMKMTAGAFCLAASKMRWTRAKKSWRPADRRAVDQEELALEALRERPADRRLARSPAGPASSTPRFGLRPSSWRHVGFSSGIMTFASSASRTRPPPSGPSDRPPGPRRGPRCWPCGARAGSR